MKKTSGSLLSPSFSRWRRGHHCLSNEERSSNVFPLGPGLFPVIQRLGRRNPCSDMLLPTDYSAKEQIWVSQCRGAHGKFLHYLGSYVFNTSALCYRPRHALHLFFDILQTQKNTYLCILYGFQVYIPIHHTFTNSDNRYMTNPSSDHWICTLCKAVHCIHLLKCLMGGHGQFRHIYTTI
jgi:hypothetical protein